MRIKRYQDARGQWRWSAVESNGRIIADGSEGYETADALERGIRNVVKEFRKEVSIPSNDGQSDAKARKLFGAAIEETQQ